MKGKRFLVLGVLGVVLASACSDAKDEGGGPGVFGGTSGGSGDGASVECTHPGAGKSLGNDRCECSSTRDVAGEWSGLRSCREGNACPLNAGDDSLRFTQTGTSIRAESSSYALTGTLCGDFIVWQGGPTSSAYKECGQLRLTDDSHFVRDSCYVLSGDCRVSFGQGCPSQKGQCTGTGAKKPAVAAAIVKSLCL